MRHIGDGKLEFLWITTKRIYIDILRIFSCIVSFDNIKTSSHIHFSDIDRVVEMSQHLRSFCRWFSVSQTFWEILEVRVRKILILSDRIQEEAHRWNPKCHQYCRQSLERVHPPWGTKNWHVFSYLLHSIFWYIGHTEATCKIREASLYQQMGNTNTPAGISKQTRRLIAWWIYPNIFHKTLNKQLEWRHVCNCGDIPSEFLFVLFRESI